ncbi:hypothetical protein FB451DRAFT_1182365 [Mycena latifolia]|nr:hypothetical protein FB451DRAFT_1182365 [Mycena latifolia]
MAVRKKDGRRETAIPPEDAATESVLQGSVEPQKKYNFSRACLKHDYDLNESVPRMPDILFYSPDEEQENQLTDVGQTPDETVETRSELPPSPSSFSRRGLQKYSTGVVGYVGKFMAIMILSVSLFSRTRGGQRLADLQLLSWRDNYTNGSNNTVETTETTETTAQASADWLRKLRRELRVQLRGAAQRLCAGFQSNRGVNLAPILAPTRHTGADSSNKSGARPTLAPAKEVQWRHLAPRWMVIFEVEPTIRAFEAREFTVQNLIAATLAPSAPVSLAPSYAIREELTPNQLPFAKKGSSRAQEALGQDLPRGSSTDFPRVVSSTRPLDPRSHSSYQPELLASPRKLALTMELLDKTDQAHSPGRRLYPSLI